MMSLRRVLAGALAGVIVAAAGCGKDDDDAKPTDTLEGTWKVAQSAENSSSCEGELTPKTDGPAFFRLLLKSLIPGTPAVLSYNDCSDAATCEDTFDLSWNFSTKTNDTWVGESQMGGGFTTCTYIRTETTAKLVDGKPLLERRSYSRRDQPTGADGKCGSKGPEYEAGVAGAPCTSYEVLRGEAAQ